MDASDDELDKVELVESVAGLHGCPPASSASLVSALVVRSDGGGLRSLRPAAPPPPT